MYLVASTVTKHTSHIRHYRLSSSNSHFANCDYRLSNKLSLISINTSINLPVTHFIIFHTQTHRHINIPLLESRTTSEIWETIKHGSASDPGNLGKSTCINPIKFSYHDYINVAADQSHHIHHTCMGCRVFLGKIRFTGTWDLKAILGYNSFRNYSISRPTSRTLVTSIERLL